MKHIHYSIRVRCGDRRLAGARAVRAGRSSDSGRPQRTAKTAQKAPIAIAVVKPEEPIRQNVTRAEDLSRVAPSLPRRFYAATSNQPWVISQDSFQSDASPTLAPNSDRWFAPAFVDNIEHERRISQSNVNATLSTQSAIASAPRTYGIRIGARFNQHARTRQSPSGGNRPGLYFL